MKSVVYIYKKIRKARIIGVPEIAETPRRPRSITVDMEIAVTTLLDRAPYLYQDEIADFIWESYEVRVTQSTVCRLLKRIGITRKTIQRVLKEHNQDLRSHYQFQLRRFEVHQFIYVDKYRSDDRTRNRRFGYTPSHKRALVEE